MASVAPPRFAWRDGATLALIVVLVWSASNWWQSSSADRAAQRIAALARPGDITMLSSVTCVYCEQARRWLSERRIPFDECFIERDTACASRYQATLAAGTPTLLVRGQRQVGFNASAVAEALERRRSR